MSTEVSVEMRAVRMMSGMTFWLEKSQVEKLDQLLASPKSAWPAFIEAGGQRFNPHSIEGIYTPAAMDSEQRRKNGQWLCKFGEFHDRLEKCACISEEELKEKCIKAAEWYKKNKFWPTWAPQRRVIIKYVPAAKEMV